MKKNIKGFSLVELMVSISIMSVLISLATPNFASWLANLRVVNTATGYNLAIMQARAEAIKLNQLVTVTLGTDTSWEIKVDASGAVLNKKMSNESSTGIAVTLLPVGSTTITFNGQGLVNSTAGAPVTSVAVEANAGFNSPKKLNLVIGDGGATKICDPAVTVTTDDNYCKGV